MKEKWIRPNVGNYREQIFNEIIVGNNMSSSVENQHQNCSGQIKSTHT